MHQSFAVRQIGRNASGDEKFELLPQGQRQLVHFFGVDLEISGQVLMPREETELLARSAASRLEAREGRQIMIDMCCGSGNLALAIAARNPDALVWGSDVTPESVATARRNVSRLALEARVRIVNGDMFGAPELAPLKGHVDLVVCNPPYISSARLERDRAHLLENEPREAFDGGPYGISILQRLVREAVPFLKTGGLLAFEFGEGQEKQAAALLARTRCYGPAEFFVDDAGVPRVAIVQRNDAAGS